MSPYPSLSRESVFAGQCERIRAMARLDPQTGCREWTGGLSSVGYGRIRINGKGHYVHRVAWAIRNGDIPEGMVIDHLCRNPKCCNPDHLELVTQRTNALRGMSPVAIIVRNNVCCRGHEFTPENTYVSRTTGYRQCRACNKIRAAKRVARNRAKRAARQPETKENA